MNLTGFQRRRRRARRVSAVAAFTLPELLVASTIFLLLIGALLQESLTGLRTQARVDPRMTAEESVRALKTLLSDDIQRAVRVQVGNGGVGTFTVPAVGDLRTGNALDLQIPTNGTHTQVRYFVEDQELKVSQDGGAASTVAAGVVNGTPFSALWINPTNAAVEVLRDERERMTIEVSLEFNRISYRDKIVPVGGANIFQEHVVTFLANQRGG